MLSFFCCCWCRLSWISSSLNKRGAEKRICIPDFVSRSLFFFTTVHEKTTSGKILFWLVFFLIREVDVRGNNFITPHPTSKIQVESDREDGERRKKKKNVLSVFSIIFLCCTYCLLHLRVSCVCVGEVCSWWLVLQCSSRREVRRASLSRRLLLAAAAAVAAAAARPPPAPGCCACCSCS